MHIRTGPQYIEENIKALYTFEKGGQEIAVLRLIETSRPAVTPLIRVLEHLEAEPADSPTSPLAFDERLEMEESVRNAVTQALVGIGEPAVTALIQVLQHGDKPLREQAAHILNRIGKPAIVPLTELLHHHATDVSAAAAAALSGIRDERAVLALQNALRDAIVSNRKHRAKLIKKKMVLLPAALLVLYLLDHFVHHMSGAAGNVLVQIFIAGSLADTTLQLRRNAVSSMAKSASTQMVGAFAACLEDRDKAVKREATEALKRLLPKVQASDKRYVSFTEMNILLKRLGGQDQRLTLAILKALEQIGDERALPKVEAIASKQNAYPVEVITAARECLPSLRQLAEASRQANTLLRASEPSPAPETLLRAASGTTVEQSDQLLRPQL